MLLFKILDSRFKILGLWTPASAGMTGRGQGDKKGVVIPAEAGIQVNPLLL